MATRLYLRNSANALSGTFPTGEQSASTATHTATNANTLLEMLDTAGSGQTSRSITTSGSGAQSAFFGFWVSPTLAAQTLGPTGGGNTWLLNLARLESNLNSNFQATAHLYLWRPSTGSLIQTFQDWVGSGGGIIGENGSASTEQVGVSINSTFQANVACQAGDVLILEVWRESLSQGMASSYTNTIYWDGTTVNTVDGTTVSNHASFIEFTQNITFVSNKEIAADAGSYTISGTVAGLELDRVVVADGGSYAISGTDATLAKGRTIVADGGSYAISGTDAALEHDWQIVAGGGSYAINGTDATLTRNIPLNADAGSYTISGTDAALEHDRQIVADGGSYAVGGTDAALEHDKQLVPDSGAYAISGTDAALEIASNKTITADEGAYAITGTDADLLHDREIVADAGSYAISGTDADLIYASAKTLDADSGSYVITGTDADLLYMPVASTDDPPPQTLQGGGAEAEIQAYHARRHARLKQIELAERRREEAKQALAVEEKKAQAKNAARKQSEAQKQKRLERIAKYQAQITDIDASIAEALAELRQMLEAEQNRQQAIADRRRRLLLVTLAAV